MQLFDPFNKLVTPEKCGYFKRMIKFNAKLNAIEIYKENENG